MKIIHLDSDLLALNTFDTKANEFAFDGCHKFYLIQTKKDRADSLERGYDLYPMNRLPSMFQCSCPLRFINTWKLKTVIPQCAPAVRFEWVERGRKHWVTFKEEEDVC